MFTVKHIDTRGNETLIECERFVTERRSDGFMQYLAYGAITRPNEDYIATWCGDDRVPLDVIGRHNLFVMNRFGSTVAKHCFVDPDFSAGSGYAQADPALLAA